MGLYTIHISFAEGDPYTRTNMDILTFEAEKAIWESEYDLELDAVYGTEFWYTAYAKDFGPYV
jgi:hypothetical protein